MPRLGDRAYQLIKSEVERYYSATPEHQISQEQHLERMILLARLETLHEKVGRSVTQAQLWEEICDILPNFDRKILKKAGRFELDTPLGEASVGVGIAGIGAATLLMSAPLGIGNINLSALTETDNSAATNSGPTYSADAASNHQKSLFETAKAFGWQAALKGQNPPHSADHWGEAATLWQQAINLLEQIPRHDRQYALAQEKKAFYQQNLRQIQARQLAAQNAAATPAPSPQFSRTVGTQPQSGQTQLAQDQPGQSQPMQVQAAQTPQVQPPFSSRFSPSPAPEENALATARQYGWQAALASQNAPHPVEKWADISRLWQLAIQQLDKIDTEHSDYAEAQQVKSQYAQNLTAIRQRYRLEQDASQRLQSLQATLTEVERSHPDNHDKRTQMQAIVDRLRTVPADTVAYQQAQQLIATTVERIQALPENPSTRIAISE